MEPGSINTYLWIIPIGSIYAIYGNIYHQHTPNVSIYTIHGSYGILIGLFDLFNVNPGLMSTLVDSRWFPQIVIFMATEMVPRPGKQVRG